MICINLPARRRGFALVIVLSAVVLMTILLLAYFSRAQLNRQISFGSAGMARAEMLANTATDMVVGDLVKEMELGSIIKTTSGTSIFLPSTNASILPSRSLPPSVTSLSYPNLIKISRRDIDFAKGVHLTFSPPATKFPSRAVAVSTLIPSTNGRFIGLSRWDETRLSQNNFTADMAPDWVLITRSGLLNTPASPPPISELINRSPANTNRVIGRFAYAIYDMGGLLDATVAGFPSSLTVDDLASKPNVALADLTALGLTQLQVDDFVAWRNAASATSRDTYLAQVVTTAPTNGFLQVAAGDRTLFSRQELIDYATRNSWPATALVALGTRSREINAPSWAPDYDDDASRGGYGTFNYRTVASTNPAVNNPHLMMVRRAIAGTIEGETVKVGEPLVRKRFALGQLKWLGPHGPVTVNGGTDAKIKRAFGLVWDASNLRWTYTSPEGAGTTPAPATLPTLTNQTPPQIPAVHTIKTLSEVANLPSARDPDFFELLKAGILEGSTGKVGTAAGAITSGVVCFPQDSYPDYQIIRIGVCLIDQADEDSLPTEVLTTFLSPGSQPVSAFGVESLPYLQTIRDAYYRPVGGGRTRVGAWILPHFWNPHFDANVAPPSGASADAYPIEFRFIVESLTITPTGAATDPTRKTAGSMSAEYFGRYDGQASPGVVSLQANTRTFDVNDYILFQRNASQRFRDPIFLQPAFADAPGDAKQIMGPGDMPVSGFVGLVVGGTSTPGGPQVPTLADKRLSGTSTDPYVEEFRMNVGATRPSFLVQAKDSLGQWRTYQRWHGLVGGGAATRSMWSSAYANNVPGPGWIVTNVSPKPAGLPDVRGMNCQRSAISSRTWSSSDPRTTRFGVSQVNLDRIFVGYLDQAPSAPTSIECYNGTTLPPNTGPAFPWYGNTPNPNLTAYSRACYGRSGATAIVGWTTSTPGSPGPAQDVNPGLLPFNLPAIPGTSRISAYRDVDGVSRMADYYLTPDATGLMRYANPMIPYNIPIMNTTTGVLTDNLIAAANQAAHPRMLNRPFLSVSEMGYAFRDMPWKTLDFFSANSGDSGLLDLFSVGDVTPAITAGKLSLNSSNPAALEALIRGSRLNDWQTGNVAVLPQATAAAMATAIVAVSTQTPFLNRSELVTRTDLQAALAPNFDPSQHAFKGQREVVLRALGEAVQTRTWNLLLDLVVQSGRIPANATSADQFVVEGEKRYWVHLAIDRFTGKVFSVDMEPIVN